MSYVANPKEYMRRYRLPEQLENARRKLRRLVREAEQLGMHELLSKPELMSLAWEREAERGRLCVEIDLLEGELSEEPEPLSLDDMDEISNRVSAFYAKGGSMVEVYD